MSTTPGTWVRVDHDAQLIKERNEKSETIYRDLEDIKTITDITHDEVVDQKEKLDKIEANVEEADKNVEEGTNDVQIADEYHTCCGCCCCCCKSCTIL